MKTSLLKHHIIGYLFFGALHELAHFLTAAVLLTSSSTCSSSWNDDDINWLDIFFFRRFALEEACASASSIFWIRHAGWIVSVVVALLVGSTGSNYSWAAWMTALEALSTDLCQLPTLPLLKIPHHNVVDSSTFFFCGNFGIIFLNAAWYSTSAGRKTGLDLLQKMISITMMRGAQTGGVVTFLRRSRAHPNQLRGLRSRVVNNKRSDLSVKVRRKMEADAFSAALTHPNSHDFPETYFGHTRFATSSIANFDGTHPHQWTPPQRQRVFRFDSLDKPNQNKTVLGKDIKPQTVAWENFITHNGDLDFFDIQGTSFGLDQIQAWLAQVTGVPMPSSVDSVAIAGLVDLIHTQGCFPLSARYALLLKLPSSSMVTSDRLPSLNMVDYGNISVFFETALMEILAKTNNSLDTMSTSSEERHFLVTSVLTMLQLEAIEEAKRNNSKKQSSSTDGGDSGVLTKFLPYLFPNGLEDILAGGDEEAVNSTLRIFCQATVNAFFDNDLLQTTKTFLSNAKGSFGVGVTSSMTAHRQMCLASRGQTVSVAFYPKKGVVCYGSEQAATRAGLSFETPGGDLDVPESAEKAIRLDLDDLNGEVLLLDWGPGEAQVSPPNQHWPAYKLMDGKMNLILIPDGRTTVPWSKLYERMTLLEGHEFVNPLSATSDDPVLKDICDIPRICRAIQEDWRGLASTGSLNRLSAWNLTLCLKERLTQIASGAVERGPKSVDILLTGCEVSLWVAEQFASDLQKAFPKLGIKAVSSNKLLGLFGQDLSVPAVGYPMSEETHDMKDAIMIIVSQSGGTFGPLCCANLMKSLSQNLFVVTSEWDTQVAKQLRSLHQNDKDHLANSRIFSTNCGFRTAEPSSISVAATHQLLTNLFEHISIVILSNPTFRGVTGALITERDLQELERCNQLNIAALEEIVGVDSDLNKIEGEIDGNKSTEMQLREAGDLWAEHVLEGARAYIMLGIYVFATVISGYPLIRAIAIGLGVNLDDGPGAYIVGLLDACIYFWFTQIAITLIRWWQGRNYLHRMVGRTVVVADIPWVSQAADSFLSKLFACSYSIAGLNVLSANPADHLVHRHTHRVVRGSLLLCGRPDGRLSALTSLETSTCLAVNQACSIQSLGGTCEAITIGHNPFQLPLSKAAIFLGRHRPDYLCERVTGELDQQARKKRKQQEKEKVEMEKKAITKKVEGLIGDSSTVLGDVSAHSANTSRHGSSVMDIKKISAKGIADERQMASELSADNRSAAALQGAYLALAKETSRGHGAKKADFGLQDNHHQMSVDTIIEEIVAEKRNKANHRETFNKLDRDGTGKVNLEEFVAGYKHNQKYTEAQIEKLFYECNGGKHYLTYEDFVKITDMPGTKALRTLQAVDRPRNLLQVEASKENYFGETLRQDAPLDMTIFTLEKSQRFSMELYESRCASLQRFVSMTVMFHQLGKRVEQFFPRVSFGVFGYRMDRSHSITRIQTTASPVSGAEVRERIKELELRNRVSRAVERISFAWTRYRTNQLSKHQLPQSPLRSHPSVEVQLNE